VEDTAVLAQAVVILILFRKEICLRGALCALVALQRGVPLLRLLPPP
jgi:hypothetical protein